MRTGRDWLIEIAFPRSAWVRLLYTLTAWLPRRTVTMDMTPLEQLSRLVAAAKLVQQSSLTVTVHDWRRLQPASRDAWEMARQELRADEAEDELAKHSSIEVWA